MPRTTPMAFPDLDDLPADLREEVGARRSLNVYRMIMHAPDVARPFLAMSDALRYRSQLNPAWRELAILRVGHACGAIYETHHHQRVARAEGLSEAAISAARVGGDATRLPPEEQQVLRIADELLADHGLSEPSRDAALRIMSVRELEELVMTIGFYQQVSYFLNTFGVPVEPAPETQQPHNLDRGQP